MTSSRRISIVLFALAISGATGCATARIDESFTAEDPETYTRSYPKPARRCLEASKKALMDLGAEIERAKGNELVTNRYAAFEYAVGNSNSAMLVKQTVQIQVRVEPAAQGCRARVVSVRAWQNNKEYDTLSVGYTKEHAVEPFFKNLDEALSL
jgi:Flp pilus assembly protein TadD